MFRNLRDKIRETYAYFMENRLDRKQFSYFDWTLILIVLALCAVGVVAIFAATASPITEMPNNWVEMMSTQSLTYPLLQLRWVGIGLVFMGMIAFFNYNVYGRYASVIYAANILVLVVVLGMEAGRGGMSAFFRWGGGDRTIQPSEFGKVAMIICMAKLFATRQKDIATFGDLVPIGVYVGIPLVLVLLQPDVGTALVYLCIFAILLFCSKMDTKLIVVLLVGVILLMIPAWYVLSMSSDNFRLTRILMWLDPEAYPDEARQIINAQIAIGSGGMFGKGIVSPGSLASLGYISDDHTDMIYAIVCEAFGYVGGALVIGLFAALIIWLIILSIRVKDPFGSFIILGVMGMFLFHVFENIGMVIGLMPCTGIPLSFISYGGSHMLTAMMAIGLVENVVMRDRYQQRNVKEPHARRM